jgi:proteasome lid subunit RPN8/RPN11
MLSFSELQNFKKQLQELWIPEVERCGVIEAPDLILEKPNRARDPKHHFQFDIADLESCHSTWHTHPATTSNLSIDDYHFFKSWPRKAHFIISSKQVRCYLVRKGHVFLVDEKEDHPERLSI